jgi:hypothetical protein
VLQEAIADAFKSENACRAKKKKKPGTKAWTLRFRSFQKSLTEVIRFNPGRVLSHFEAGKYSSTLFGIGTRCTCGCDHSSVLFAQDVLMTTPDVTAL